MPVDTQHADFKRYLPDWRRLRDVIAGQRSMQDAGSDYLRRPLGITDNDEWNRYVLATPFFEATQRTVEGLSGLAFFRTPEVTLPDGMKDFQEDATQDGVPLEQFMEATFDELVSINRVGILVDMPVLDPKIKTVRDAEAAKRRPFLRRYEAEQIFNWATGKVNGAVVLTEVRLAEIEAEPVGDFDTRYRQIIRVLQLNQVGKTWEYVQRIFAHRDWIDVDGAIVNPVDTPKLTPGSPLPPAETWLEQPSIIPLMNGKPLDFIPFWIISGSDHKPDVRRPPLLGLANLNVAHYNTTASLENALFWTGNAQPWVAGVDPQNMDNKLRIGSSEAWIFKDPNASVGMLSLKSEDFAGLWKRTEQLEGQMAVLGARMLQSEKRQTEAAETARIHRQGEISVLGRMCNSLSRAMSDIARVVREWSGIATGETKIKLNTVFFDMEITLDDLMTAVALWQKNVISIHDLISLGKRADVIAPERTVQSIVADNQSSPMQPIITGLTDSSTGLPAGDDPAPERKPRIPGKLSPPKPAPTPA